MSIRIADTVPERTAVICIWFRHDSTGTFQSRMFTTTPASITSNQFADMAVLDWPSFSYPRPFGYGRMYRNRGTVREVYSYAGTGDVMNMYGFVAEEHRGSHYYTGFVY